MVCGFFHHCGWLLQIVLNVENELHVNLGEDDGSLTY